MRVAHAATLLFVSAILGGCVKSRPRTAAPRNADARESVLLTRNAAAGRRCSIVNADAPLPTVGTVIDTAAMPEYLQQTRVAPDSGYALYSLRFDSTGKPVRARLIEATIADSLVQPLQQALASALLDRGAGTPVAARLRIDFTPAPVYRIGKSEYCDPEAIPQTAQRSATNTIETIAPGPAPLAGMVARRVTKMKYELVISPSGAVTNVRFIDIEPRLESDMRNYMLRERWRPALDDALPVEARVTRDTNDVAVLGTAP